MEYYDYPADQYPSSLQQRHQNFSRSSDWKYQGTPYPTGHLDMEQYSVNASDYGMQGNQYSNYDNGLQKAYSSHLDPSHHHLARGHSHHSTRGYRHEDLTHAMPGSYPAGYDRDPYNQTHSGHHQLHHPYPERIEPQQSVPNSLFQEHPGSFRSPSPYLDEMSILNRPVAPSRTYSLGRQSYRSQYNQPGAYGQSYHPSGMSYSRSSSPRDSNFYYSSRGSYDDPYIDQAPYNGNYYTNPHYYGHPAAYNTAMYPNTGVAGGYSTMVPLNGGAGGYMVVPTAGQGVQVIVRILPLISIAYNTADFGFSFRSLFDTQDTSGKTSHMYAPGYTYYGESFLTKLFSPSSWGFSRRKSSRSKSSRRSSRSRRGSLWSFLDDL